MARIRRLFCGLTATSSMSTHALRAMPACNKVSISTKCFMTQRKLAAQGPEQFLDFRCLLMNSRDPVWCLPQGVPNSKHITTLMPHVHKGCCIITAQEVGDELRCSA